MISLFNLSPSLSEGFAKQCHISEKQPRKRAFVHNATHAGDLRQSCLCRRQEIIKEKYD